MFYLLLQADARLNSLGSSVGKHEQLRAHLRSAVHVMAEILLSADERPHLSRIVQARCQLPADC